MVRPQPLLSYSQLEARQLLAALPIINEFQASNNKTLLDGNGISSDWIEIYNAGDAAVNLAGWSLTDDAADLSQWVFPDSPSSQLAPSGYLIVFASGDNTPDQADNFHTNFRLSAAAEYLALVDREFVGGDLISETVVSEFGPNGSDYPPQFTDFSYGFGRVLGIPDLTQPKFFTTPTPGLANGSGVDGFVADNTFSVERGFYGAPISIDIRSTTPGTTLVYTTDGSQPSLTNGTPVPSGPSTVPAATVAISTTTTLRARAYKNGFQPSDVDTHTYLFLANVIQQPAQPTGFPTAWGGTSLVDYEMDPQVVNDAAYHEDLLAGLRDLPSLSLSSSVGNFFGSTGIYSNPQNDSLEIPISAEYILPDGSTGFQVDAGLKIAGGASRMPNNSPKHSFSLRFRAEYGASKLNYKLFDDTSVESFNSLQLRSIYNNSWIHRSADQRSRGTLIHDQFIRDSLIAMGQDDAGAGNYAHLYLNGLYWGVYNVHERADASHFAEYQGGNSDDYDALNGGTAIDGNLSSFNNLKSVVDSGNWEAIQQVLDVDNFIDWALIQEYGGNSDLKTDGNWRAAGGGSANAKWKIYSWDSEHVLEGATSNSPGTLVDATGLFNNLKKVPGFVARFGDRIQLHYFNDGALTPTSVADRWNARVDELQRAIVAESARWGDYRRDVAPAGSPRVLYTRDQYWVRENTSLNINYFPTRSDFVVNRYKALNLFPDGPQIVSWVRDNADQKRPDLFQTLTLMFDTDVNISAGDLSLRNKTLDDTAVNIDAASFSYNSLNFTATWNLETLTTPLPAAFYTFSLSTSAVTGAQSDLNLVGNSEEMVYVAIPGDANLDGDVDVFQLVNLNGQFQNVGDLAIVKSNLGNSGNASWRTGDFNADGDVDVFDFSLGLGNVGDLAVLYTNLGRNVRIPASASALTTATPNFIPAAIDAVAAPMNLTAAVEEPTVRAAVSRRSERKTPRVSLVSGQATARELGEDSSKFGDSAYDLRKTNRNTDQAMLLSGSLKLAIPMPMTGQTAALADDRKCRDQMFAASKEFDLLAIAPRKLVSSLQALKRV